MGLSGYIGEGANVGLEELLTRQLLEAQQAERVRATKAQEAQQRDRLAFDRERFAADEAARQEDIEQGSIQDMRATNTAMDARMSRLQGEEDQADAAAALQQELAALMGDASIPEPVKRAARLKRVGVTANPDDLVSAEEQAAADKRAVDFERQKAQARRVPGGDTGKVEWLLRNGEPVKGTYQAGDKPYDPVAARSSQPVNASEAQDTAAEVQRLARELKSAPGMRRAFGVFDSKLPTMSQDTANAEAIANSLRAVLTLENMGKMKGVLSDSDMRVLQQASTTLQSSVSDAAAARELDRLDQMMAKITGDTGGAAPAPAPSHAPSGKNFKILGVK